jgi:hypothetical protein
MSIINTINRLRRTVGLKDYTPKAINDQITDSVTQTLPDTMPDETPIDDDMLIMEEFAPLDAEVAEMDEAFDESYLQYSSEVVGFGNREQQWNAYRSIITYINPDDSFIDFGCGRGDFIPFYMAEYNATPNYIGIDLNEPLIDAGKSLYPDSELILTDWFNIDDDLKADWAINVGSCNLRYDADTVQPDEEYTKNTIRQMYNHCNNGLIIMLASGLPGLQDGLIDHNPGEMLNWAQKEFSNVALDHSLSDDVFCLIIYK